MALVVGLLAGSLPPQAFWWAQLVAIALPYLAWAATGLALVALLIRWNAMAAVTLLLVGVVVLRAWPGSVHAPADGDLVLTTFNVPQTQPRDALGDSSVAFARRTAPALIAMQDTWVYPGGNESDQATQARAVALAGDYRIVTPDRLAPRTGWQRNGMGTPLLVRTAGRDTIAVLDQEEIVLASETDASLALRTRFSWQGREAVLYNVHLRSFGEPKPWRDTTVNLQHPSSWKPYLARYRTVFARRGSETEALAQRIEAEALPVIVVGDFNSTADNWSVRRLLRARQGTPFVDAYREAGGWRWGRTYHARDPLVRIDFVLVDPDAFEVAAARTHAVGFSDHRPVEVHLRWR